MALVPFSLQAIRFSTAKTYLFHPFTAVRETALGELSERTINFVKSRNNIHPDLEAVSFASLIPTVAIWCYKHRLLA